jgi:RNA polymerase sigma-70 factor (ECF subfamily)
MTAAFPDDATIKDLERRLTTFFKARLPESTDPRDFVTDVLMTLPNYRGECSLKTYVFAVARKQLADRYRNRYRYRQPFEPLPSDDDLETSQTGPSTELHRKRVNAVVRAEAEAIEPVYGGVVLLWLDGLEPHDIAERIDVHYHTVRSRLARGLERVRARLAVVFGADGIS